ncbi:hypothetical protein FSP39_017826 [Pinctada imbricata]|uniref:Fibrinogen C-terminal domain-containing protein n=1 Tax=Pinctada imbricata TaxID=66713 RepID=A0AA89C9A9_PINIB|nr:hypothetical protein FSP39_017826 [Pinctada imbricata]
MWFTSSLLIFGIALSLTDGHKEHHLHDIKNKATAFLNNGKLRPNWHPDGTVAELSGPLSLILKYKFKAPLHKKFNVTDMYPDCHSIKKSFTNLLKDGVYTINIKGMKPKKVYCDMTTDGGGWTVFQRRKDGSVDFYRPWKEYKEGFGSTRGEYWLGNSAIHELTQKGSCELRIDMTNWQGTTGYAKYGSFKLENEANGFQLRIGKYTGNAVSGSQISRILVSKEILFLFHTGKDSLAYHNNMKFSTKDVDNDNYAKGNCAVICTGAWWDNSCNHSGLNGNYKVTNSDLGVEWDGFPNGKFMKSTKMMFRCK